LTWNITGIPDWLSISLTSGTLNYNESVTISASVNYDNLTPDQDISGTIQINSNSISGSYIIDVHVSKETIPSEVLQINGIVTDAEYNHESGLMVICTKSPNSLIIFNSATSESNTILLNMTPNCVSISEDGHKAVIGYTVSSISYIDIDTREILQDFAIDCIPYDIVLGDDGWCYITPSSGQFVSLLNLNVISGQFFSGTSLNILYEKTIIRKVHGKPNMIGTRTNLSPTGILMFDLSKGTANDTIGYYHIDIGNFWISEDGTKMYDATKKVYQFQKYDLSYHFDAPAIFGQIESDLARITAFDECPAISSVFIASFNEYYQSGYPSVIEQFNTTNLNKIKTFTTSSVFVTDNGIRTQYLTDARFIFVNKEGSVLYALKNLKVNYDKDRWSVETFQINNTRKSFNVPKTLKESR
jgi:hypothetical protein